MQPAERLSPHNPDNKTNLGTAFHFCGTTALHFFKVQFSVLCCDSVFMVWSHLGAKNIGKGYEQIFFFFFFSVLVFVTKTKVKLNIGIGYMAMIYFFCID